MSDPFRILPLLWSDQTVTLVGHDRYAGLGDESPAHAPNCRVIWRTSRPLADQTTSQTSPLLVLSAALCAAYSLTGESSRRVRACLTLCDPLCACRDRQTYQRSIEKHL